MVILFTKFFFEKARYCLKILWFIFRQVFGFNPLHRRKQRNTRPLTPDIITNLFVIIATGLTQCIFEFYSSGSIAVF